MKRFKILLSHVTIITLLLLSFYSCSSEEEQETVKFINATYKKVHEIKIDDVHEPQKLQTMFDSYLMETRALGIPEQKDSFDYNKSKVVHITGKDAIVYCVPSERINCNSEKISTCTDEWTC